ncbi:hypothetical protein Pfo_000529 [Paulownia fortunei]|nr:hypothetical protein Pfo_000529 [Paulownia fortunei]
MELQLKLALSSSLTERFDQNQDCGTNKKRSFDEAFSDVNKKRTLPLLIWDDKQHCSGELEEEKHIQKSVITNRYVDEEEDVLVGWPPVKSWMKKFCQQNHRQCTADNYITVENDSGSGGGGGGRESTSMYVKVKMEGIGIARKVDLSIHHSYQSLTATLVAMFGKCQENVKMYKLTYQDREGDWLLAGDVPWESFIQSVQRLKLLNNGY